MALWTPEQLERLMEELGESEAVAEAIGSARRLLSGGGLSRRTREVLRDLADYAERSQEGNRRAAEGNRRALEWNIRQQKDREY